MTMTFKTADSLTSAERVEKAVVNILRISQDYDDLVPMSGVLQIGTRSINTDIPTARTNGRDEEYADEFVKSLTDPELRGLILHESLHKQQKHLIVYYDLHKKYGMAINAAEDYYINAIIKRVESQTKGFIKLPESALHDPKYDGMSVIEILRDLLKSKKEEEEKGEPGEPGNGGTGDKPTLDEHDYDSAKEFTEEEQRALEQDIDDAVRQAVMTAGKYGKGKVRDEIVTNLRPKIDWAQQMRDYVSVTAQGKDFSTWRRPNRRYVSSGLYLPSSISETMREIAIAPDMSGSTHWMRDRFFTEMLAALEAVQPDLVHLLYWDTGVHAEKYTMHDVSSIKSKTAPMGGGGTTAECVPRYMAENNIKPECVVMLTDGHLYGGWGEWTCPVFWVIISNPSAIPTVGKYVHVSREDF